MQTEISPIDHKLTACFIFNNESHHVEAMLQSIAPHVDYLVGVRACGNVEPDNTAELILKMCNALGKPIQILEYKNANAAPLGTLVDDNATGTWPHVDNFADARQASVNASPTKWNMWIDCDDVFGADKDSLEFLVRLRRGEFDQYGIIQCTYDVADCGLHDHIRERWFQKDQGQWAYAIHEMFLGKPHVETKVGLEPLFKIKHSPNDKKDRTFQATRNIRIALYATNHPEKFNTNRVFYWFYLHRELMSIGRHQMAYDVGLKALEGFVESRPCMENGVIIHRQVHCYCTDTERYFILLNLATCSTVLNQTDLKKSYELAQKYLVLAKEQTPERREAYLFLTDLNLMHGHYKKALAHARAAFAQPIPTGADKPWNLQMPYYQYPGLTLLNRALRACGLHKEANNGMEGYFKNSKWQISVLHPVMKNLNGIDRQTNSNWIAAAQNPLGVQWIYGANPHDGSTTQWIGQYRHVGTEAYDVASIYNELAETATGGVILLMADGYLPCHGWDYYLWNEFGGQTQTLDKPLLILWEGTLQFAVNRAWYTQFGLLEEGISSNESRARMIAKARREGLIKVIPSKAWSIPKPYYVLPHPDLIEYPSIITAEVGKRYIICGKEGDLKGQAYLGKANNFQSLTAHYELGWEVNTSHVRAKHLLAIGQITNDDTIVTLPGREFLYTEAFKNVITWNAYCDLKDLKVGENIEDASSPDTLDIAGYFIKNGNRFPNYYFEKDGKYAWTEEAELITSFSKMTPLQQCYETENGIEPRYICMALRIRPHMSERNTSLDYARQILHAFRDAFPNMIIYLVGLNLPNYGIDGVVGVNLQEWTTLCADSKRCALVAGPLTGTTNLAGIVMQKPTPLLIFPHQYCHSIDGNVVTGLGKCVIFNDTHREFLPVLCDVNTIIKKAKELVLT